MNHVGRPRDKLAEVPRTCAREVRHRAVTVWPGIQEASMKRSIRSALRSALPLALLLGAAILPAPAFAGDPVNPGDDWNITKSVSDPDGSSYSEFQNSKDKTYFLVIAYETDGTVYLTYFHKSGPGPDDPTGKG